MTNPGMDADIYDAFIEQLQRYVRERLIPAEDQLEELGRTAVFVGRLELGTVRDIRYRMVRVNLPQDHKHVRGDGLAAFALRIDVSLRHPEIAGNGVDAHAALDF